MNFFHYKAKENDAQCFVYYYTDNQEFFEDLNLPKFLSHFSNYTSHYDITESVEDVENPFAKEKEKRFRLIVQFNLSLTELESIIQKDFPSFRTNTDSVVYNAPTYGHMGFTEEARCKAREINTKKSNLLQKVISLTTEEKKDNQWEKIVAKEFSFFYKWFISSSFFTPYPGTFADAKDEVQSLKLGKTIS